VNFPADEKGNFAVHHECVLGNRTRGFANSGQAVQCDMFINVMFTSLLQKPFILPFILL
jgi:hypothetical protein